MGRAQADAAIADVATARERLAHRVQAPWWYRWGIAAAVLVMFFGMGLVVGGPGSLENPSLGTALIAASACIAPVVLLGALKNATGVSVDRYAKGLGWWWLLLFGLLAAAFGLQAVAGVPFALTIGGLIGFAVTVAMERHIDAILRRDLHDARRTA